MVVKTSLCLCSLLERVYIEDGLTKIDSHAFRDCGSLASVTVPDSVTEISEDAFQGAGSGLADGRVFAIKASEGSYARRFAEENEIASADPGADDQTGGEKPGNGSSEQPGGDDPESGLSEQPITKKRQKILISKKSLKRTAGSGSFRINAAAKTKLIYSSNNPKVANVSKKGTLTPLRPGKVKITLYAEETDRFCSASTSVILTVVPAKPYLKAVNLKSCKVKITWSKVEYIKGYELFVKAPGEKRFRRRVIRSARVKSVTHRGLRRGTKYRYKVRVFTKVNGRKLYSSFSAIRTIRVRK